MLRFAASIPALFVCAAFAQTNALTPAEAKDGWRLLFDGKSLAAWIDPSTLNPVGDGWIIEDSALRTKPDPRYRDDMITREVFNNFELAFEWRVDPGANGGVKYMIQNFGCRAIDESKPHGPGSPSRATQRWDVRPGEKMTCNSTGYEYQIVDNQGHRDGKDPSKRAGSMYGMIPAEVEAAKPAGEWNQSRIVVRGADVEHWLNGVRTLAVNVETAEQTRPRQSSYWKKASPIALQHHNDTAWYRSIKVRRLPD